MLKLFNTYLIYYLNINLLQTEDAIELGILLYLDNTSGFFLLFNTLTIALSVKNEYMTFT